MRNDLSFASGEQAINSLKGPRERANSTNSDISTCAIQESTVASQKVQSDLNDGKLPGGNVGEGEKKRNRMTQPQLMILMRVLEHTAFPRRETRAKLAESFGMEEKHVRIWFQNQRQKYKRQLREKSFQIGTSRSIPLPDGSVQMTSCIQEDQTSSQRCNQRDLVRALPNTMITSNLTHIYNTPLPQHESRAQGYWQNFSPSELLLHPMCHHMGSKRHLSIPLPAPEKPTSSILQAPTRHHFQPYHQLPMSMHFPSGGSEIGGPAGAYSHYDEDMGSQAFRQQALNYYPGLHLQ